MRVAGVVLAAGRSARAGGCKALALVEGRTLVTRAVDTLRAGGCASVVVVVAAPHARAIAAELSRERVVENPAPELGMFSSLQLGVRAADAEAVVFSLVDHPFVRSATVAALIASWRNDGGSLLRPRCRGSSGHPVLIAGDALLAVQRANPERTTRDVLAAHAARDIEVDDEGILDDLDTGAALTAAGVRLPAGDPIE